MTKFLTELITDETNILDLSHSTIISNEEKKKILDLRCTSKEMVNVYIKSLYYNNLVWYYFKKDYDNYEYPFHMIDELLGMFLCKKRELTTLDYKISKVDETYGLASENFKTDKYNYHTFNSLIGGPLDGDKSYNIDLLKLICVDDKNEEKLLKHMFELFAIDIIMLQKDRCGVNLQFQIDKQTNELDLAPIYDFSNCYKKINKESKKIWNLKNVIYDLNEINIKKLLEQYPMFKEELDFYLEQNLLKVWDEICKYYNLNQDCSENERVKDYLEIKQKSINENIRQLVK